MTYCRPSIREMHGYVPGEQPRDRRYIKLNTNENPYPPSPAVASVLAAFDVARLRLYPDPVATQLRTAAGEVFGLPPDWILCGNGSDDLLTIAVRTYAEPDGVLACFDPSYSLYPVLAQIQASRCVKIPLTAAFDLPDDTLRQASGATLLFLARPNAPTGNAFDREKVRRLCREFSGIVWIDEAYADFAEDNCLDFVQEFDNVVVSRTLSKSYSLAGLRLGLAFARPSRIQEMLKVKDSYNVSMLTQIIGAAALRDQPYMTATAERLKQTREEVSARLAARGFSVLPSSANFIFARPPAGAADFMDSLRRQGILIRHFPGERTGDYVRITIGTAEEMVALLDAVDQTLSATR